LGEISGKLHGSKRHRNKPPLNLQMLYGYYSASSSCRSDAESSVVNNFYAPQTGGYIFCLKYAGPPRHFFSPSRRVGDMLYRPFLLLFASALASTCSAFTNPIKSVDGSDPFMVYSDGYYYLTSGFHFLLIMILSLKSVLLLSNYLDQCSNFSWHSTS
jgi:hypothetical protein